MTEPQRIKIVGDNGPDQTTICRIVTSGPGVPLRSGGYRLVCGVPRKFWPWSRGEGGTTIFHEAFEYELIDEILKAGKILPEVWEGIAKTTPLEILEIEGHFEADGCYWQEAAQATLKKDQGEGTEEMSLPGWPFRLYEGDKLYTEWGALVFSSRGPE